MNKYNFNGKDLSKFNALYRIKNGASWEAAEFGGEGFAKIATNGKQSDSWLISPRYDLSQVDSVFLLVSETLKNPIFKKLHIKVSIDYKGEDPAQANWVELSHEPQTQIPPDLFTATVTQPVDLSSFVGEKIVLAFHFEADSVDDQVWEVNSFSFFGEGDKISYQSFSVDWEPEFNPCLDGTRLLKEFSFTDNKLQPFYNEMVISKGKDWHIGEYKNQVFAKIYADNKTRSDTWLVSPTVSFSNADQLYVQFEESLRDPIWSKMLFKVSANYQNGDPYQYQWSSFDRSLDSYKAGQFFSNQTPFFDLSEFAQGPFVFSFHFLSEPEDNFTWQVIKIRFCGSGSGVKYNE